MAKILTRGASPDLRSRHLYSHADPLHHAVRSGSLETVKILVAAGATPDGRDDIYDATPLGWASYARNDCSKADRAGEYEKIIVYLRARGART